MWPTIFHERFAFCWELDSFTDTHTSYRSERDIVLSSLRSSADVHALSHNNELNKASVPKSELYVNEKRKNGFTKEITMCGCVHVRVYAYKRTYTKFMKRMRDIWWCKKCTRIA